MKEQTLHFALLFLLQGVFLSQLSAQKQPIFKNGETHESMSERWELDSSTRRGNFLFTAYKPVYVMAGRWSSNPNEQPRSENPNYSLPFRVDYDNHEAKFQLSFKTKIWQGIFGRHGDLWIAYTQRSHWQIYNQELSRPFRETNYEPEIILNFATNYKFLGLRGRMFGIAFNHQSNGRALPLSRSWNRVIGHIGFERGKWNVYLRGWYRVPDEDDENPAATDYIGVGETTVIFNPGKHQLTFGSNFNFDFDTPRGSIRFDWMFPISGNLKGYLQLSEGYGETLVDYNHRQTTIGIGISLIEW